MGGRHIWREGSAGGPNKGRQPKEERRRGAKGSSLVYREDALQVASLCRDFDGAAENGVTECLRLVPAQGAQLGVSSIEPGGVGSQVAFLRTHLMNAAGHKLPQAHERVW